MSIRDLLQSLSTPSTRFALGTLVATGLLLGVVGVAGFEFAMQETSSDEFCLSCHELADNVGKEYVGTSHHTNSVGLEVTCANCHLPTEFVPKMIRKVRAAREIYHHLLGTIDTPEKFDAHRMRMATWTWAEMNTSDSRECRNCHDQQRWDLQKQSEKARQYHDGALAKGKTCIDCHKGLAHKLPEGIFEDEQLEGIDF
jgi:cytochrome c-type protein NapC